jgi:hypothetical protein
MLSAPDVAELGIGLQSSSSFFNDMEALYDKKELVRITSSFFNIGTTTASFFGY